MRHVGGQSEGQSEVKYGHLRVNLRVIFSKTGPKLSKTSLKPMKTQSNGRVNLKYSRTQPGTLKLGCVLPPLGSPTGP